ncbi:unnamed protein product, partial [marine sediment metagenome]
MMLMKAKNIVLSRLLPKTGQIISYRAGDDGTYQAGWWRGLLNENNKERFIHIGSGENTLTKDLATGLMWPADGESAGCNDGSICGWEGAIIVANALDFAGFSDWRLPNVRELMSIVDYGRVNPTIDLAKFPDTHGSWYWSSTMYKALTT